MKRQHLESVKLHNSETDSLRPKSEVSEDFKECPKLESKRLSKKGKLT